jgi:hypothetical protein
MLTRLAPAVITVMKRALLWSLVFSPFLLVSTAAAQPGAGFGRLERPERNPPTLRQTPLSASSPATMPTRTIRSAGSRSSCSNIRRRLDACLRSIPRCSQTRPICSRTQLATFLTQHPEIAHNPSYYFDQQFRDVSRRQYDYNDPKIAAIRAIDQALGGLAALMVGLTVIGTAAWLIRSAIEYRKWLRVSKTHVETHAKLMDRLTSNEDLVAYMQSPAGRRFLKPLPFR